ncbi:hypothetical protein [Sporolactobacillus inulinus]|uniref:Histone acetyltransferase n=2 Tax=Sporolactobacillus inulinus TaxID=2078 RepID=A0A4Y1ZEW3_9BACL|nr:hypothetical protein [Sporolactobacillus inulinus]KLI03156.1 hypothetical protein SINU_04125 [Sporolactobacillus inulinus CASD]GAY77018.1 hypothetical protein NBRC111894_2572 [Sporolactobacillus inulinus]GEB76638.1 hypothetical protein SIN01_09830 [Sporolactobacillus inulinus]
MNAFLMDLMDIRPSQLYLDQNKVERLNRSFDPLNVRFNAPLPVRKIGGEVFLTDGHTRAFLYRKARVSVISVYWDTDDLDMQLYQTCIEWCRKEKILFIDDLKDRVLPHDQFVKQWIDRCAQAVKKDYS